MSRLSRRALAILFATTASVAPCPTARAAGGDIVLRTDGGFEGGYYTLGGSGEDRFITEYLAGSYRRGAVVCGARVRAYNAGTIPPPGVLAGELRLEDPANLGYPDLSAAGLVVKADPESLWPCDRYSLDRFFTFGRGAGVPDPGVNHYVCAVEPLHGTGVRDFCGLVVDTSGSPFGAAKTYSGGQFGRLPWNHALELVVFVPPALELGFSAHGSPRFPGDAGRPVVFTTRRNAAGSITDDLLSLTIVFDNPTGVSIPRSVEICADRAAFDPTKGPKRITHVLRARGSGEPIGNPILLPPGRTVLGLEVRKASIRNRLASLVDRRPVGLPIRVYMDDPSSDSSPCRIDGLEDVAEALDVVGLRRRPGSPDDDLVDAFFVVQTPTAAGDAFNVRLAALDLPRTVAFVASGFEVVGAEFAGAGLPGLDAIELRTEDPIFAGSPDLGESGLLRSFGTADGVGEAPLPEFGAAHVFDVPDLPLDPTAPGGFPGDLFVRGLLLPGETVPVTAIGADQVPQTTLLGDSSFTRSGILPDVRDPDSNYMLRLLIDGDRSTLPGTPLPGRVLEDALLRRPGEMILMDRRTGRRIE